MSKEMLTEALDGRELFLADLGDTTHTIAVLWSELSDTQREGLRGMSHDLHDALETLVEQVNKPITAEAEPDDGSVVTGYPPEKRAADLERMLDAQRTRAEALHHARKSWGGTMSEDVDRHARNITTLAQAFERYLTTGATHEEPVSPNADDDDDDTGPDLCGTVTGRNAVMGAALAWVDTSHLNNPGGPNNWRNWSDEHDQALINAVLAYRGMPPLEVEKP